MTPAALIVDGPKEERSVGSSGSASRRLVGLDAARGAAMLLTCLSHFSWSLVDTAPGAAAALTLLGMIATPAFLLLSGAVVGATLQRGVKDPGELGWRLVDRGLFVMVAGHVLLAIALAHYSGGFAAALDNGRTTDAIGFAAVIAGMLVACGVRMPSLAMLVLLVAAGWVFTVAWHPAHEFGLEAKWLLFGHLHDPKAALPVAEHLAPYLALYFFGTHVGRRVVAPGAPRTLALWGTALATGGVMLKASGHFLATWTTVGTDHGWAATFAPTQKLPPSPAYLLFYGGLAVLVLAGCLWRFGTSGRAPRLLGLLVPVGRASLVVYVFQYVVYATIIPAVPAAVLAAWPLVLAASLVPVWTVARVWAAWDGNRWLTVGLMSWHRRHATGTG